MDYNHAEKSLRWLANQFPKIEEPKDNSDKMVNCIHLYCENGANTIAALLARAEAAEAELEQKEKYYGQMVDALAATDSLELTEAKRKLDAAERRCETLEKMVKEYQETIIPGYRKRTETAEETASDLCDDFTDFVTGGVHNAAPYCANRRPECVNAHGWCDGDNRLCRGFMPKAAARNKDGGFDVPLSQQAQAEDPQR